jgi:FkbM family methyltransferase
MNFFFKFIPTSLLVPLKYYYYYLRDYLEPEMVFLNKIINKGDISIDVGGNWGAYSYYLYLLKSKIKIFEPNLSCSKILKSWAKNKKNINVFDVALSNYAGKVDLKIPFSNKVAHHASGTIHNNIKNKVSKNFKIVKQSVFRKKLDTYNFQNVKFIKIDVEGHELKVIQGALKTIQKFKPILLVEIEQRHHSSISIKNIFNKILNLNYSGFFYQNNNLISINVFNVKKHQKIKNLGKKNIYINNFFFIPKKYNRLII